MLVDMLLGRDWPRANGTTARIEQLVVEANWGRSTQTVSEFCTVDEWKLIPGRENHLLDCC